MSSRPAAPEDGRTRRAGARRGLLTSLARGRRSDVDGSQSSRAGWIRVPPMGVAGADVTSVTLRPWPWDAARALLAGQRVEAGDWHEDYPLVDTTAALAMLLAAYEVDGSLTTAPVWWVYQVLAEAQVVGDVGFHGPPAVDGPVEVEIGYGTVPQCRGRGIATAACGQLLELAWQQGADVVLAEADEDNPASRQVLHRNGFHARADGTFAIGRPA